MPQPKLAEHLVLKVRKLLKVGTKTYRQIADEAGVAIGTVHNIAQDSVPKLDHADVPNAVPIGGSIPDAFTEPDDLGGELPDPVSGKWEIYRLPVENGSVGIISDVHIPYHDKGVLELFVSECKRRKVSVVHLNGDILDCGELSRHDKSPTGPKFVDECEKGIQFFAWLRGRLGRKVEIIYKAGNHEERLDYYLIRKAPELFGVDGLNLRKLLRLADYGVTWVSDRRVVKAGRLNIIHGHEYPGGASSPVNPARGLYLKAKSVAICGHHHRTSEHHDKDINGKFEAAWSVGCACYLYPDWYRINQWNHGFAFVELDGDYFSVDNRRVIDGKIV